MLFLQQVSSSAFVLLCACHLLLGSTSVVAGPVRRVATAAAPDNEHQLGHKDVIAIVAVFRPEYRRPMRRSVDVNDKQVEEAIVFRPIYKRVVRSPSAQYTPSSVTGMDDMQAAESMVFRPLFRRRKGQRRQNTRYIRL
ncbi:hypothetical protein PR048_009693 [Dryococelus australis]|uniref:Secreted protein n=1 Tax=Dryococelus australis TaxID=614101 RepID=A0ABQ9I0M0_9NEOP|nr:hypothetical protein PR048_009693 [Dryococelus australis]